MCIFFSKLTHNNWVVVYISKKMTALCLILGLVLCEKILGNMSVFAWIPIKWISLEEHTFAPRRGNWVAGDRNRSETFQKYKNFCAFGILKQVKCITYSKQAKIERQEESELKSIGLCPPLEPTWNLALCLWHCGEGRCSGMGWGKFGCCA